MAEGGAFMRGFGYKVEKETPRQMLGALEDERDLEREEEHREIEAAMDAYDTDQREKLDQKSRRLLQAFEDALFPNSSWEEYDGISPDHRPPDAGELVGIVEEFAERARRDRLYAALPEIGARAMGYLFALPSDTRSEYLDLRDGLRALNEITRLCGNRSVPKDASYLQSEMLADLDSPLRAYARLNAGVSVDERGNARPWFSERDIDALGARVSRAALLRQAMKGLTTEEQRRALVEGALKFLLPNTGNRRQGNGYRDWTNTFPPDDKIRDVRLIRRAFPFMRADIMARAKGFNGTKYDMNAFDFQLNPRETLGRFRSARRFAEECGIEANWKDSVVNLWRTMRDIPAFEGKLDWDADELRNGQREALRALAAETWEFLPVSVIAENSAIREFFFASENGGVSEKTLAEYASVVGIDWVPGTKWPNEADVRALYAGLVNRRNAEGVDPYLWALADEIERLTGWDRFPLLSDDVGNHVIGKLASNHATVPATRQELLQALRERYREGRPLSVEELGAARFFCGPEAFALPRENRQTAEVAYRALMVDERKWRHRTHGGDVIRRYVLHGFAEANGLTPDQEEFLGHGNLIPMLERFSRAKELGLSAPFVSVEEFSIALDNGTLARLIPLVGKARATELVRLTAPQLGLPDFLEFAAVARTAGLPVPKPTTEQFHQAVRDNELSRLQAFLSNADLLKFVSGYGYEQHGADFVRMYLLAKSRKMAVPEMTALQFQDALGGNEGEGALRLVGKDWFSKEFARIIEGDPFCSLTFYLGAGAVAKKHGLAVPGVTDRLFASAIGACMLDALQAIVPRETMAKGCSIFPAGIMPQAYLARVVFSRKNGFSYPEATPELARAFISNVATFAEALTALEPSELSRVLAGVGPNDIKPEWMRSLVVNHLPALRKIFAHDRAAHQQGVVGFLLRLNQIQPPSKNPRQDAWQTDLPTLLARADRRTPEGVETLLDYLQNFGMRDLPILFEHHAHLFQARTIAKVDSVTRRTFEGLGVAFPSDAELARRPELSVRGLVSQLRGIVDAIPSRLMRGEEIPELETRLGGELFKVLLGETEWNRTEDSIADMRQALREAERRDPSLAKVPSAFREAELAVVEAIRSADIGAGERLDAFLASREVRERFGALADGWRAALGDTDGVARKEAIRAEAEADLGAALDGILVALASDDDFARSLPQIAPAERSVASRRHEAAKSEKGRAGLERQAQAVREAIAKIPSGDGATEHRMVEWIAAGGSALPLAAEWLRELSARDMARLMPEGMVANARAAVAGGEPPSLDAIDKLASVHGQYVEEHYLNPGQNPEHTGHPPYERQTLRALEKAWHLTKPRGGTIAIKELFEKGRRIAEGRGAEAGGTVAVRMIPVSGLLRVYSGEIGDACYSSRHAELARGAYPNLNAWVYGTTDDQDRLKLQGSVLGLNLTTTDGMPTLVVRANNPKESFARSVDASSFVLASLREAVATARRQWQERKDARKPGPQIVSIPLDPSRASCTNRDSIAAEYHRRFTFARRLAFQRTPEAAFNNYDLTNPNGVHPCVEIWRIDADGKETWTGNWE